MFGRLRPPPSSPDCLERCPAKIIKDDPLSVYESTLLKLKQGSRLDTIGPNPEPGSENQGSNPVQTPDVCSSAMAIDSGGSGQCENSKDQKKKNPSVLSMFCRYKNLDQAQNNRD